MSKAQEIFNAAFSVPRDPRSPEYRAGVLHALRFLLDEAPAATRPYRLGTAAADAYQAGWDEGRQRAREYLIRGILD